MEAQQTIPDKLRRHLIFYVATTLLLIAVFSMLLMGFTLVSSWKETQENRLLYAAELKAQTVAEWMRQNRHLARQIAARTGMRQEMEALNSGQKTAAEVIPFITRAIHDSLTHSTDVVGITRLDNKGRAIAQGGRAIPQDILAHIEHDKARVRFTAPQMINGEQCILLSAPIVDPTTRNYLGSDVIAVSTATLKLFLRDNSALGVWHDEKPLWFCALSNVKQLKHFDAQLWQDALQQGTEHKGVIRRTNLVLTYTPVSETPWVLLLAENPSELYAPVWKNVRIALGGVGLLYLLCLGGVVVLSQPLADKILIHTYELEATIAAKTKQLQMHQAELEARVAQRTQSLAQANAALRIEEERRKELSRNLIHMLEEIRTDISRDLHDHTGQLLTTLRLSLENIRSAVQASVPEQAEAVHKAGESVMNIQRTLKTIAKGLRPPCMDYMGLVASLEALFEEYRQSGLCIVFFHKEIPHKLDANITLTFYRIAQEALTNILRHAHANKVYVNLTRQGEGLTLSIEDDGQGFDVHSLLHTKGPMESLGLTLMRERMTLLDGEFSIESAPGRGTQIIAWAVLPHKETQDSKG